MEATDTGDRRRVRKIDWGEVLRNVEGSPIGTAFLVGRLHRSVATQINSGKYRYINPAKYVSWSSDREGETSNIWLARKP